MNFGFTEDQELLREQARRFVEQRCPLTEVRKLAKTAAGFGRELWRELAELGWCGLLVPEAQGGAGLGWVDAVVVLEATGAGLVPGPLASTLLASAAITELGSTAQRERFLPKLATGETTATVALLEADGWLDASAVCLSAQPRGAGLLLGGDKAHVHDVGSAELFVVAARASDGLVLALVERSQRGVTTRDDAVIDRTKRTGALVFDSVEVAPEAVLCRGEAAARAFERLADLGAVAITAEMVGAAEAVHRLTVEYAKQRIQFGRPIGQYQGVKHPLAEMYVDLETFRSLLYHAAWTADRDPEALPRAASMAKAYASDAFARIGIDAIQLHGAIGYTAEYDAQLFLKRSKWARPAFGDADHHYERIATLGGV